VKCGREWDNIRGKEKPETKTAKRKRDAEESDVAVSTENGQTSDSEARR